MIGFHGKQEVKQHYLDRARAHRAADEIAHGVYYEQQPDGRMQMCAVGCTIHGSDHSAYERELGIPRQIAYLEDRIFENLPDPLALDWPIRFLEAVPVGADLSRVVDHLMLWLLVDKTYGVLQYARPQGAASIKRVATLYRRRLDGETVTEREWRDARVAAAAASAAAYAAYAASASAAASADADAASAAASAAAAASVGAARHKAFEAIADKLIDLLSSAPVAKAEGMDAR